MDTLLLSLGEQTGSKCMAGYPEENTSGNATPLISEVMAILE